MNKESTNLAARATQKALFVRKQNGIGLCDPVCIYDLVDAMGLELRFVDIPSMEGIYLRADIPTIVLSSLRPTGRQAFTCAHELGHHVFEHGEQFDEIIETKDIERRNDPQERMADIFAAILLMPKSAVERAFKERSIPLNSPAPEQIFEVSTWLGVGYATLVNHMDYMLKMISPSWREQLLKKRPAVIRREILGETCGGYLVIASRNWTKRAIDLQVGDYALLPRSCNVEGDCISILRHDADRTIVEAVTPGIGRAFEITSDWASYVRVCRKQYVGRGKFRFHEEVRDAS